MDPSNAPERRRGVRREETDDSSARTDGAHRPAVGGDGQTSQERGILRRTGATLPPPFRCIESHGVVGDLATCALVALDGTVDFMCFPRFDSPTVFAALLDLEKGGEFALEPIFTAGARSRQLYLPDTNVLLTRTLAPEGVCEITDTMPAVGDHQCLVRTARAVRGDVRLRLRCAPRFDYARSRHRAIAEDERTVLFLPERGHALRLRATAPIRIEDGDVHAELVIREGETVTLILDGGETPNATRDGANGERQRHADAGRPHATTKHGAKKSPEDVVATNRDVAAPAEDVAAFGARAFEETVAYWRSWASRSRYQGRWREIVHRSALVLKLLTSREHGAIIAAPTFGLPESPGGSRNWDYRYTWIRDAGFALYALMRLGYTEEATAFMNWVHRQSASEQNGGPPLQIMYGIAGEKTLTEIELPHLAGYGGAKPVRIGNGAYDQLQLDIHGALLDAVYLSNKYGEPISYDGWVRIASTVDWVCENWTRADEGIWEFRGGRREFLHSRLMCWVAVDRAIRLADKRSLPAPFGRWIEARTAIHRDIYASFWDEEQRSFVQSKGSKALDASCLLMPLFRFVSPVDPRWLSTLDAIGKKLASDCLVRRYDLVESAAVDGLEGDEGTFTACSFWYVECLARAGRIDEARLLFEKMLGFANHLGLFSEEVGASGEHLGNFPQALTHLALISAAYTLDRELSGRPRAAWER